VVNAYLRPVCRSPRAVGRAGAGAGDDVGRGLVDVALGPGGRPAWFCRAAAGVRTTVAVAAANGFPVRSASTWGTSTDVPDRRGRPSRRHRWWWAGTRCGCGAGIPPSAPGLDRGAGRWWGAGRRPCRPGPSRARRATVMAAPNRRDRRRSGPRPHRRGGGLPGDRGARWRRREALDRPARAADVVVLSTPWPRRCGWCRWQGRGPGGLALVAFGGAGPPRLRWPWGCWR
jgi:hypothetical protein